MGDEWGGHKYERVDGQLGAKYSWRRPALTPFQGEIASPKRISAGTRCLAKD